MRQVIASMGIAAVLFASGCGDDSSSREAGRVAVAFAKAMSRLDIHKACQLSFTNRHGLPYRGKTEADKKRECEKGEWLYPISPRPGQPPEFKEARQAFGFATAVPQSVEIKGNTAWVTLLQPHTKETRNYSLHREKDRWLVYEVNISDFLGG